MSTPLTEADVLKQALDYPCPDCGAAFGVRCRILTPNRTNPARTKVDVRRKPCPGRARIAWRGMLDLAENGREA